MAIRIGGIMSGVDTEGLINKMISAQRARLVDKYVQKNQILQWKQGDYRDTNIKLQALRTATSDLRILNFQAKKAESSNESIFKATIGANAVNGTYTLRVHSLASAASINGNPAADYVHSGPNQEFTLTGELGSATLTITEGADMKDIVGAINSVTAQTGIRASYDEAANKLYMYSTTTGTNAKIEFSDPDGFVENVLNMDPSGAVGQGAKVEINNSGVIESFDSNTFEIMGINFDIKQIGEATVTVKNDVDLAVNKIKAFVEAYNNVMEFMYGKINEKFYRDFQPLTDEQKAEMTEKEIAQWEEKAKSGLLKNDYTYSNILSSLRMATMDTVTGLSPDNKYTNLTSLGISTTNWMDQGKLTLDEDKLRAALEADPEMVEEFFKKSDGEGNFGGLTTRIFDNLTYSMTTITNRAGNGYMANQNFEWGREIDNNEKRISTGQERLNRLMERYWKQFTAMETALARMQSQSDWLDQQINSINSLTGTGAGKK